MFIPWPLVIRFILWLISIGFSRALAVKTTAAKFGLSEAAIWKHGGF